MASEFVSFSIIDYLIFISMLVISSAIGIYYGFIAKIKQNNTAEYLLGGKKMSLWPIALSLIVTHISGITMLGIPAEIYAYGSQFWISIIPALVVPLSLIYIFYPVFYDLKLLSSFMYFERRFSRGVRLVAGAAFCFCCLVYTPMFIYIPALAFNQVSGVSVHIVTAILSLVCVFYTTLGGLRAVVWTDAIQFVLMFGAVFAVIILGILNMDNPADFYEINDSGGRMIWFDLNPSPLVRTTVWTVVLGQSAYWASAFGISQSTIQKLQSLPNFRMAKKAIWIFTLGIIIFNMAALLIGLIIYANLFDCDPYKAGLVRKLDQVVPYFVMRVSAQVPGIPGLFIAGLFSGGLSSMSGALNTLSCVIYDDFLRNRLEGRSEKAISNILKLIVLLFGLTVVALVFLMERLSTVFELFVGMYAVTGGAIIGLFTVGMLCRRVNTNGAICGTIAAVLLVLIMIIGSQSAPQTPTLPMRTDGCSAAIPNWNNTTAIVTESHAKNSDENVFWLFRISFMYYVLIGCVTVWIVSYPVSLLTPATTPEKEFDENLLAPFMRRTAAKSSDSVGLQADNGKT